MGWVGMSGRPQMSKKFSKTMAGKVLTRRVSQISPESTTFDRRVRARAVLFSGGSGWGFVIGGFRASWWYWFLHNTHRIKNNKISPKRHRKLNCLFLTNALIPCEK